MRTAKRTKQLIAELPHLKRVCDEIDADNGAHHAERLMPGVFPSFVQRFAFASDPFSDLDLKIWNEWIATLDDAQIDTLACGEHTDREQLMRFAPPWYRSNINDEGLDAFFNRFFDPPELQRLPILSEETKHVLTLAAPALLLMAISGGALIIFFTAVLR